MSPISEGVFSDSEEEPYSHDPDNLSSGEEVLSQGGTSESDGNPLDTVYEAVAVLSGYSRDWVNLHDIFAYFVCVKNVVCVEDSVCMAIEQWVLLDIMMLDADSSKVKFLVQPFR